MSHALEIIYRLLCPTLNIRFDNKLVKKNSAQGFILMLLHSPLHISPIVTLSQNSQACYKSICMYPIPFNPLNAKLNPICHLLVLLDLTFMGPCIVSIFQYISNKMQHYTVHLYLKTALHVSGGISTHHQEHIQLYLRHLVLFTPLLLSSAIVEELEPV
jgi:hypothetical protein